MGSVLYLAIGWIILFYISKFLIDKHFKHDTPGQNFEGGGDDDMYNKFWTL